MDFIKNIPEINQIAKEMSEIAGYLWQRGWAERNAGNISINISGLVENITTAKSSYAKFERSYPALSSRYFLVSGAERRMRDLAKAPEVNAIVIKIDEEGTGCHNFSNTGIKPTSEFPSHLAIHEMIASRGSEQKVVMHTHATELIALTQIREFCNQEKLNQVLMGMHPETRMYIPKGVGFVPFTAPGSEEIALKTIKALEDHDTAIWEKHGVFAIGESLSATFDLIDILAKAAKIYFMLKKSEHDPEGLPQTS